MKFRLEARIDFEAEDKEAALSKLSGHFYGMYCAEIGDPVEDVIEGIGQIELIQIFDES